MCYLGKRQGKRMARYCNRYGEVLSDEQVEVDRRGPPRGAGGESFVAPGCRIMAASWARKLPPSNSAANSPANSAVDGAKFRCRGPRPNAAKPMTPNDFRRLTAILRGRKKFFP